MDTVDIPALYKKYHVDRNYELRSLFTQLKEQFAITSFLYPGCYVHLTPSLYIPRGVYVDTELSAKKFFSDPQIVDYIKEQKTYTQATEVTFYHQSYTDPIDEPEQSFDLIISQYAGFVSEPTKKYLKPGGVLLANNSHGDAGLVAIDTDFTLVAVANNQNGTFVLSNKDLEQYFIPKKKITITPHYLKELGKGIGYTKTAMNYVFKKVR